MFIHMVYLLEYIYIYILPLTVLSLQIKYIRFYEAKY